MRLLKLLNIFYSLIYLHRNIFDFIFSFFSESNNFFCYFAILYLCL